jgi:DNA-binding Lrp family transcriptional regulator
MELLNSLSAFVVWARKNPLWAFAWTAFGACLWFGVGFLLDSPNRIGVVGSDISRFSTYIQDYYQTIRVKRIVQESYDSYNEVINELNVIGGILVQHQSVPMDQTTAVVDALRKFSAAQTVHVVTGPYDVIVYLESRDFDDMGSTILEKIRTLPGVKETLTCMVIA